MSATHPNGFVVKLLATLPFGMRLRLHWWPVGGRRLDSPHDHRSWFVSLPLMGSFVERRYREARPGAEAGSEEFSVLRCDPTGGNGSPRCEAAGRGRLELVGFSRRRWLPYFCPGSAIHSFLPSGPGFAASLVLFGPPRKTPRAWIRQ